MKVTSTMTGMLFVCMRTEDGILVGHMNAEYAAEVVRIMNAHDGLVAALAGILEIYGEIMSEDFEDMAEAALKAAKEQP